MTEPLNYIAIYQNILMDETVAKLQKQLSKLTKRVTRLEAQLSEAPAQADKPYDTNQSDNTGKTITLVRESASAKSLLVTGQTYDLRQIIKDKGGKWDKEQKGWKISSDGIDLLQFEKELLTTGVKIVKVGWDKKKSTKSNPKAVKMKITKTSKDTEIDPNFDSGPVECTILSDSDSD